MYIRTMLGEISKNQVGRGFKEPLEPPPPIWMVEKQVIAVPRMFPTNFANALPTLTDPVHVKAKSPSDFRHLYFLSL